MEKKADPRIDDRTTDRRLKVFLCHASEDKAFARILYDRLEAVGVDPRLDEKNLKGGQDWDCEIRRAVKSSDVVIVCLSTRSITKEGYVHIIRRSGTHSMSLTKSPKVPSKVALKVRLSARAVLHRDAIFLAAAHQGLGMKLFPVIHVDYSRQPTYRPIEYRTRREIPRILAGEEWPRTQQCS
jgi:hypothetical protein